MFRTQTEISLVMAAVAVACAVPGAFLLLRRMSLVSDAIGHVLLFGIVVAYLVVRDLQSPWVMVGAAASGVLAVALVELLQRTRLVKADAAIGLVFTTLFAAGVVLVTLYGRAVHLDVDAVLTGQPEFATYPRLHLAGVPVRPLWVMTALAVLNAVLVAAFYKELKLSTFDPGLAAALGFLPGVIHYGLMGAVSLTAVAAFDAAGPVLVVAFFVVPAMTAYLLTDRLWVMLVLSAVVGAVGAWAGVWLALRWDTNTAGMVACVLGAGFALAFVLAPGRGLVAQELRRFRQRRAFLETMLAIHLLQHEGTPQEPDEAAAAGLHAHLGWPPDRAAEVARRAERHGLVERAGGLLKLTPRGRAEARNVLGGWTPPAARVS